MKLIGLTGKAGAGKDTLASLILEHTTGTTRAFADPMRRAAKEIFGLTDEQMTDRVLKEQVVPYWGMSPRRILQLLGTESVRGVFGGDTWVKNADLRLEALMRSESHEELPVEVCIWTDCRVEEEAEWIRANGGIVVEVRRPGIDAVEAHSTEQGLPPELVDGVFWNNGTIDELRHHVSESLTETLQYALPVHEARKRLQAA
ncbi:hypothetical protein [Marinobacterium stanieri]|uniref:deoxynucleotide monophosphate kinase family protein n=1 Tax=Marinobacterium stanieri TaxID=49186 RepID=UPI000255A5E7|nr:hypothetical protein [Marinobacterium stanieri]